MGMRGYYKDTARWQRYGANLRRARLMSCSVDNRLCRQLSKLIKSHTQLLKSPTKLTKPKVGSPKLYNDPSLNAFSLLKCSNLTRPKRKQKKPKKKVTVPVPSTVVERKPRKPELSKIVREHFDVEQADPDPKASFISWSTKRG